MKKTIIALSSYLMLCCFLCCCSKASGKQTAPKEITLAEAFKEIAGHYQVNFVYEDQTIAGKTLQDVNLFQSKSIAKTLDRMLPPLGLAWFNTDQQNYAIYAAARVKAPGAPGGVPVHSALTDSLRGAVSGYIKDERGHAQSFATVSLIKAADSTIVSNVLSDTSGFYQFIAVQPGNYKIKAAMMGYEPSYSAAVLLGGHQNIQVEILHMKPLTKTLNEVKITATRPLVERKADRFIFNVENSPMASGSSLQLLRSAPFVRVSPDNVVTLQGKRTMILIDGRPVPGAALEDILQTLPAGNISSVELITEPSSKYDASYGAVINIITKKNQLEGTTGNIRSEYSQGDYARANVNSRLTYKHNNLTLFGSAGYNRVNMQTHDDTHRSLSPATTPDLIHEQITRTFYQNLTNFQVGGNIDLTKNQSFGALVAGRGNHTNGSFNSLDGFSKSAGPLDSALHTGSPFHNDQHGYDYNVNYHLLADSGKSELTVFSTLSPLKRTLTQNFASSLYDAAGTLIKTPAPYQSVNTSSFLIFIAQADFSRTLRKQWKVETGVKYQSADSRQVIDFKTDTAGVLRNNAQNSSNNHLTESILGIYGILSKKWGKDHFRLGLRMENTSDVYVGYYSLHQLQLFPSVLWLHDLNAASSFSLAYRRTVDRAPYAELVPYRLIINQYNIGLGNPSLKPQFNDYFSLNTKLKDLNISLNYTRTQGFIAQVPARIDALSNITYIYYQNLDKASDLFIDVYYPLQLTKWWSLQNSATLFGYAQASGQVLERPFSVSAARFAVRTNQTFKLSAKIKLEIDSYYNSKSSDGLTHTGGYGNIDASFLLEMFKGKGQLRMGGDDILKRNTYYNAQDFGVYSSYRNRYLDSRRGSVSLTYNFGQTKIKTPAKKLGNEDAIDRTR
jgi:hypothetical protein